MKEEVGKMFWRKRKRQKKVLFRAYSAFDRSKLLNSIRKGFIMLIPIFTVGGFALMLMNVPIPAVKNWIESVWGGAIFNVFTFVYEATFGLMAIYILLAISYRYSQEIFGESDTLNILAAIVSVASYFALLGTKHAVGGDGALKMVVLKYLDVQSVFPALLTRGALHPIVYLPLSARQPHQTGHARYRNRF